MPNKAAQPVSDCADAYRRLTEMIAAKMRTAGQDGAAVQHCLARLDELRTARIAIADKQTRNGDEFAYANEQPVRRLLQVPFEQRPSMDPERAWFVAARSMRDTEPVTPLKIRGPDGSTFN
jgi:hypothetical protein